MRDKIVSEEYKFYSDQIKRLFGSYNISLDKGYPYMYRNGNYYVKFDWGSKLTKTLFNSEDTEFISDFPDSIDLKITNSCSWNCPFCHEDSVIGGKTMNLEETKKILLGLPQVPIEIAIGGGNVFDCPDQTIELLAWILSETPFQPRVTISQRDYVKYLNEAVGSSFWTTYEDIHLLSGGIGVSLYKLFNTKTRNSKEKIPILEALKATSRIGKTKYVIHIIAGLFPVENLKILLKDPNIPPVLVLGYKQFGRAAKTVFPATVLMDTEKVIKDALRSGDILPTLSFDNLAIEQLHLSGIPEYKSFYMGEEGKHSMYIDAVDRTFAKTSRSEKRVSWDDMSVLEFFKAQRDDSINF